MSVNQNFEYGYVIPGAAEHRHHFNPYEDNGGSIVAIAGEDYAVIGADTRLSAGLSIHTHDQKKLFKLSERTVLGATGCWADTLTLTRLLFVRVHMYKLEHNKSITTPAVAQMLSTMMYYKRFFPYYVFNVLAGLDADGKGCVYSFDDVGHYERFNFVADGSAGAQMQPLLDNQIGLKNMQNVSEVPLPREKALAVLKNVFIGAAERDIFTGDFIYIHCITAKGIQEEKFELRKD